MNFGTTPTRQFGVRLHNRQTFPTRHIIVCEDRLDHQKEFAEVLSSLWHPEGNVQIDYVCSAVAAAIIMQHMKIDLVILDHDMSYGFGSELIMWMAETKKTETMIITASGIPQNNDYMEKLAKEANIPVFNWVKYDILAGKANWLIEKIIREAEPKRLKTNGK